MIDILPRAGRQYRIDMGLTAELAGRLDVLRGPSPSGSFEPVCVMRG